MPGSHPDYQVNIVYFDVKRMCVSPFKDVWIFLIAMDWNSIALKPSKCQKTLSANLHGLQLNSLL